VAKTGARVILAAGVAVVLGRWPVHWHRHPVLAVAAAAVILAAVAAIITRRHTAAAALLCLIDAAMLVRRWSVHLPLHCHCLPRTGAPAILGWGGVTFLADLGLTALAVWISRRRVHPARA
jgi:hypothetical protein